jgi:hypothetical protein
MSEARIGFHPFITDYMSNMPDFIGYSSILCLYLPIPILTLLVSVLVSTGQADRLLWLYA